jgi:hypothetical protein
MLLLNSNVVKAEKGGKETQQQYCYLTAMLLKGERSHNSNVAKRGEKS